MLRLGELLIAAGELTAMEFEQALRAQVMWGGRIGTNLVELGYLDLDKLAVALGKQHRLPPALGHHFESSDPTVQARLAADVAERYSCVPLLYAGPRKTKLIVATISPLDKRTIAIIADDMRLAPELIVQSIAGELRIRYHLERVYNIKRSTRFLRAKGKTVPPFPQLDIDPLAFEDSQVDVPIPVPQVDDDLAIGDETVRRTRSEAKAEAKAEAEAEDAPPLTLEGTQLEPLFAPEDIEEFGNFEDDTHTTRREAEATARARRSYVRTIDADAPEEMPATESGHQPSLGRIPIKRIVATAVDEPPAAICSTLSDATRAIRRSQKRDRVAELVGETLFRFMTTCEAAQMLVIRGAAAISWRGFSRSGAVVPEIAVPLDQPGLIPRVIESCETLRMPTADLGPIDQLLLGSLGATSGDLVIVPVAIAGQVMCVIALATQHGSNTATAEAVAAAAGAAFARLMRNASR